MTPDEPLIDTRKHQQTPTLRDQFAMAVIGHLVTMPARVEYSTANDVSYAYKIADLMLQERAK